MLGFEPHSRREREAGLFFFSGILTAAVESTEGELMLIKAVIYDMDGTLVDSEIVSEAAWHRTSELMGVDVPKTMIRSFIGRNAASVEGELAERLGGIDRAHEAFRIHAECFDELADTMLALKPSARESIDSLRAAGCRIALATSTGRVRALARLARFGLQDAFDSIICGDDGIKNGKPAPDIFLLAAERLSVEPALCAVVEDSFNGVRAGYAAGMHVFMVPDLLAPTDEIVAMCDAVLPSLTELPAAVADIR